MRGEVRFEHWRRIMRIRSLIWMVCLGALPVAASTIQTASSSVTQKPLSRAPLRAWIERFFQDIQTLQHVYLLQTTPVGQEVYRTYLTSWLSRLERVPDSLLRGDRGLDWMLLYGEVQQRLHALEDRLARDRAITKWIPGYWDIAKLEQNRRLKDWIQPEEAAAELSRLTDQIQKVRRELESAKDKGPTLPQIKRALARMREAKAWLTQWYRFRADYDPQFHWWVQTDAQRLQKALDAYLQTLQQKLGTGPDAPLVGEPIGRERLLQSLREQWLAYTPEELIQIGEREFQWCERQLRQVSRKMGYGDDWKKALSRIKQDHVAPGKQPELIRQLAEDAIRFVQEHDLVTVPPLCRESWRIEMMPPAAQRITPYFTGGRTIRVAFPTIGMTYKEKQMALLSNNRHFAHATVLHELIPGHWLQAYMAARYHPYRRYFSTPFYVEGWALYWEMKFWDLGYQKDPADQLGALFWRLHRCARIIFSLKYHLGQMTAQQAVDYLIQKVGHEPDQARAEVRRSIGGLYDPLYQAAYMIGALQLRTLHDELVNSGKMTEKQFHNAILRIGPIPIELIRHRLLNLPWSKDLKPQWRFYPLSKKDHQKKP